jgi:hypothetical protein
MPDNMSNLLEQSATIDQLVIVGPNNPELAAEVVGRKARMILRDTNCSLLILRDAHHGWVPRNRRPHLMFRRQ